MDDGHTVEAIMAENVVMPKPQLRDGLPRPTQIRIVVIAALAALAVLLLVAGVKGLISLFHHKVTHESALAPGMFTPRDAQAMQVLFIDRAGSTV